MDLSFQAFAHAGNLLLIIIGCLNQFQFRFGMKLKLHRFKRERNFSKTRSPATGWTLP